jgi:pimeloyl-ACP methyl ester carboxylesterase
LGACGGGSEADAIFGRGGEAQWIDVAGGRLKTEIYSSAPLSARPTLVVVLHGDLFNPTPSYQYAFAQALTQGFDAPAMPGPVRARLGTRPEVNDVVAAGLLRPGYTDNDGDRSDGERGEARGDNYTAEVVDAVATAVRALKQRFMARRVVLAGHSGGATIAALVLGRHPDVADAALLVACGCGETRSLQPLDVARSIRRDVTVRLLVGAEDGVTPAVQSQRYAEVLRQGGVDAQVTVLPGLGHNITFTQPVFAEAARVLLTPSGFEPVTILEFDRDGFVHALGVVRALVSHRVAARGVSGLHSGLHVADFHDAVGEVRVHRGLDASGDLDARQSHDVILELNEVV